MEFLDQLNEALENPELPSEDDWGYKQGLFWYSETILAVIKQIDKVIKDDPFYDIMAEAAAIIGTTYTDQRGYEDFEDGVQFGRNSGDQPIYKILHDEELYYFYGAEEQVIGKMKEAVKRFAPESYQSIFG